MSASVRTISTGRGDTQLPTPAVPANEGGHGVVLNGPERLAERSYQLTNGTLIEVNASIKTPTAM
jgi:hypothetical protein